MMRFWFGFGAAVGRKDYLRSGFGLMAFKYAVESLVLYGLSGHVLDPLSYVNPVLEQRLPPRDGQGLLVLAFMALWALPFMWIGVSMSLRRARDAGWSPWVGLLFLFPLVNLVMIAALCVAPTARLTAPEASPPVRVDAGGSVVPSAIAAVMVSLAVALVLTLLSIFVLGDYGSALFLGTPFLMGVLGSVIVHRDGYRGRLTSLSVAAVSLVVADGALLLFALEGAICLIMATPLSAAIILLGALVGDVMARGPSPSQGSATAMVVALPVLALVPTLSPMALEVEPVVTSLEIAAPPEVVWPHVVGFSPLDPPDHWLFTAGVAAPMRARIEGEGVGAVRHCEFTTGAFVEPITTWAPPHHLAFDVTSQPPSMRELGIWPVVHAPHVEGTMTSHRGEFRLVALPDGGTRLTGTTWYTLDLAPEPYWRLWSDAVVHLIHERVLEHIAELAEADLANAPP